LKFPHDRFPYKKDARSRAATPDLPNGCYVYVRDAKGAIHVLPDGPHLHTKILGEGAAAMYAGDMTIRNGHVRDLTNLSGTFSFDDAEGLLAVAEELERQGLVIEPTAVRLFPLDGSRPYVLR
jgi:hypothetical protein